MQLSNTSKYAIRILSYMARQEREYVHKSNELAQSLDISYKFLTKIMTELVKGEFILSIRGREGGFQLNHPASSITILDILKHFQELTDFHTCILGNGACNPHKKCILHDKWASPRQEIKNMFATTTIDIVNSGDFKL